MPHSPAESTKIRHHQCGNDMQKRRLEVLHLFRCYTHTHTPSSTHNFVTHSLSHTTFKHTSFHTQLCHTPSFFVTHHLSHTTLSHTTLHIKLVFSSRSSTTSFVFPSPSRYNICCSLLEEVDLCGYPVL